jgi:integrase
MSTASEEGHQRDATGRTIRARERAALHKTRYRGLSYRQRNGNERTYLGYIPGRGRVRLNAATERAALEEFNELRGQVAKGLRVAPSSVRFKDVAEEWLATKDGRLKEWTRRNYRASLDNEVLPRFGHRKLRDITVDDIARFVRDLDRKGKSTSTIQNHLKPISQTFRYAMRRGLISINPVSLMTPEDRPEKRAQARAYEWSDEEIASVFSAAEKLAEGKRARVDYTPLLRTAVFTGLRLGELLGLQWQDVDFGERVIVVQRQWTKTHEFSTPKTAAGIRRVPLTEGMVALLKVEKESAFGRGRAKPDDLVFPCREGGPLKHRSVQRAFERIRDKAGLSEELTFHDLRHAFASLAAHAGVDTRMLSEAMGHSHAAVTARYTHMYNRAAAEENFRQALGSLSL